MPVINTQSGTSVDEIADHIFRISTPVPPSVMPGGFTFNQYLIADDRPFLYHSGPRRLFAMVSEAVAHVLPLSTLAYVGFSHVEADECGSLNDFLRAAPQAVPVCGRIAAMVSIGDLADRAPLSMADGDLLELGHHRLQWFEMPHLPHGWENVTVFDQTSNTLLCGDLFTQPGHEPAPITEQDILEPSEAFRLEMDYYAHAPDTRQMLTRLARLHPSTLACMHGSAWVGKGDALLLELAERVSPG
ncbi:MBL fold metallo-hydrolase [Noviherbaspirillum cavernae]|uniref:MBL fold metallo-hydrolase n=1 Tax=Noviherbaspirillum cavernae TaxID=2320862 RepID=A0A418X5B4_9BURK|nr:MBL fold metallo-hydrolase [Noviherbaspirillum cavernae]RJG07678.1 MBL fold metallo-hydrolase [Noviherbaspirillum cavernae]